MDLDFYQLREQPFGVSPDPAYLYPSRTHCEALDSLTEAILCDRGFLALTGEPGTGKSTLLHQLMDGLKGSARAVFLTQTQCNPREFFEYLMSELGVNAATLGLVGMHTALNEILFGEMMAGRRFVLIVDEAQNLKDPVLETIRMLSNFETPNYKLIQVILAGQPGLLEKLRREQLVQLAQRITVMKRLEPLSGAETAAYVRHRLRVAGHPTGELLEPEALALIAERSRGIPREINKIGFRALAEGFAAGCRTISAEIVEKAAEAQELLAAARPTSVAVSGQAPLAVPHKPKVIGLRRRKLRNDFVWPASTSQVLWRSTMMAALVLASMALPYQGAKRMMERFRGASMTKALAPDVSGNPVEAMRDVAITSGDNAGERPTKMATESPSMTAIRVAMPASDSRPVANEDGTELLRAGPRRSLARELGLGVRRIAIDAGHGGSDTGTTGRSGLMEKDLCLDVALRLGRLIETQIPGAQVIYTRTDDRFVALEERTAIANGAGADLFISIHANSSESREIRGVETYYVSLAGSREEGEIATRENASANYSLHNLPDLVREITRTENLAESKELATDIQTALSQRLQLVSRGERNRGVKRAPFVVLTGANMPSVLAEISFLSNPSDEKLLLESEQRQRVTEGLYRGIVAYLGGMPTIASVPKAPAPGVDGRRTVSTGLTASVGESGRLTLDGSGGHGTQP